MSLRGRTFQRQGSHGTGVSRDRVLTGQGSHGTGISWDWALRGQGSHGTGFSRDRDLTGQGSHGTGFSRNRDLTGLGQEHGSYVNGQAFRSRTYSRDRDRFRWEKDLSGQGSHGTGNSRDKDRLSWDRVGQIIPGGTSQGTLAWIGYRFLTGQRTVYLGVTNFFKCFYILHILFVLL